MKKYFFLWIFLLCVFPFGITLASSANDKAAQASAINELNSQINSLQQTINDDQGKKGQVAAELRANKEKLAQLKQHLADLMQKFNSQQSILLDLQTKQQSTLQTLHTQQATLDQQLKAFYMADMDQQSQGMNVAAASNQIDVYAAALANASEQQLQQNQNSLAQLNNQKQQVSQTQEMLKQSLDQQNASQLELSKAAQDQQQVLQKINSGLESDNQKLNQLIANRQNLQNLVAKIQKKQAEQHARAAANPQTSKSSSTSAGFIAQGQSFSSQQGSLSWPLKGRIITAFNAPLDQSGLKSTGVLLSAKNNRDVHAIYQGKVVFAGFLQGFGLLIIIDHGDGYISLYGHNSTLYRKVGDVVSTHDLVAQVDNSSAEHTCGLYFEIRHEGLPVDPASWCRV